MKVSPVVFRRLTLATLIASAVIVVTGAAVRLTGSGLGCPTWPNCTGDQLDAAGLGLKGAIEFGNRIITVAITVLVGLTAVASLLLPDRRPDLRLRSWGLVGGIVGDAVIGGITVLTHLNPWWVAVHFLFSMALLALAASLHHRAGFSGAPIRPGPGALPSVRLVRIATAGVGAMAAFVLAAGTMATGSGPHAGDSKAPRLHFAPLERVTAFHADAGMLLVGLVIALAVVARVVPVPDEPTAAAVRRRATLLVAVVVAQAALGFAQYLLHLPAALVLIHVAGATALWLVAIWLRQAAVFGASPALAAPAPARAPAGLPAPA